VSKAVVRRPLGVSVIVVVEASLTAPFAFLGLFLVLAALLTSYIAPSSSPFGLLEAVGGIAILAGCGIYALILRVSGT